jgi:hypothetical protein
VREKDAAGVAVAHVERAVVDDGVPRARELAVAGAHAAPVPHGHAVGRVLVHAVGAGVDHVDVAVGRVDHQLGHAVADDGAAVPELHVHGPPQVAAGRVVELGAADLADHGGHRRVVDADVVPALVDDPDGARRRVDADAPGGVEAVGRRGAAVAPRAEDRAVAGEALDPLVPAVGDDDLAVVESTSTSRGSDRWPGRAPSPGDGVENRKFPSGS